MKTDSIIGNYAQKGITVYACSNVLLRTPVVCLYYYNNVSNPVIPF